MGSMIEAWDAIAGDAWHVLATRPAHAFATATGPIVTATQRVAKQKLDLVFVDVRGLEDLRGRVSQSVGQSVSQPASQSVSQTDSQSEPAHPPQITYGEATTLVGHRVTLRSSEFRGFARLVF